MFENLQRGEHVQYESRLWQQTLSVVPLIFDMYLLSLAFLYKSPGNISQMSAYHETFSMQ